jgi:predicted PurR-regulated permease PerM
MSSAEDASRGYAVIVPARSIGLMALALIATLAALQTIDQAGSVFALLAASFTAAVIAAPVVRNLARFVPRAVSLVGVTVLGMVGVSTLLGVVAWDLDRQAGRLAEILHNAVASLQPDSSPAKIAANIKLDQRIDDVLGEAASRLVVGAKDPVGVAAQIGKVVVVGVIGAFLIAGGRHLLDSAIAFTRRSSIRAEIHRSVTGAVARSGSYVRRMLAISLLHGCVGALACRVWDVPGGITVGAWMTAMSIVPILGGVLAWAPLIGLTHAHTSLSVVVPVALACIVADRIARARWAHRALRVGPLLALLGIGIGTYLIGIAGAVLGLLIVAFASALLDPQAGDLDAAVVDLVEDPVVRHVPEAAPAPLELEPANAEVRPRQRVMRLRLSGRTMTAIAVLAIALSVIATVASNVQPLIIWVAVASFIAIGLDRPVSLLERRLKLPRFAAIGAVLGLFAGLVAAIVILGGSSITDSARQTAKDAPETVKSLERLPLVGHALRNSDASKKVEDLIASLPDRIAESHAVDRIAKAAGDGLIGVFWISGIMLAALLDGPRLVAAVTRRIPVRNRRRAVRFGRAAYTALSNVVAAAAFVAALNGTVVMLIALSMGIPLAPVLGVWAAFWNFIPQIGGFVGAMPLVALSLAKGPWQGVIALVVFVAYQTFENHVLQPMIGSRVVHVPPLIVLVGALFGGALAGFVGALVAGPVLGVAKIAIDEINGKEPVRVEDRQPA